jgi:hypothetical protein
MILMCRCIVSIIHFSRLFLAVFYPGFFLGEGENYLRGGGEDLFSGGQKHSIRRKNRNSRGGGQN